MFTSNVSGNDFVRAGRAWSRLLLSLLFIMSASASAKEVAGWIERARLDPQGLIIQAKLDTGARNSSLHAPEIERFSKDGKDYVRFEVVNRKGQSALFERPVVKWVRIKRHSGKSQERPVVHLPVCLGNVSKNVEVNLVDRSVFKYKLLVGRSFLDGDFIVDASSTFLREPTCPLEVAP